MVKTHGELVEGAREVMRLNSSYFRTKALQAAINTGLFEYLAESGPATAPRLCEALGLHERMAPDFLDALVGLEVLDRDADGGYRIREHVADYLVRSGALYVGGTFTQHSRMHYHAWGRLEEALKDGEAKSNKIDGTEGFMKFYERTEIVHALMNHMDTFTRFVAPCLSDVVDWNSYTGFLDLGGARGNLPALMVQQHPHLKGAVFDLPPVEPLFDEHMRELGTEKSVEFHAGDFLNDPIPPADVVIIGHVLHDWPPERRREIVRRAYPAVNPGGALLVYDAMLSDERRDPAELLQSLNCRLIGTGASEYTVSECRSYMEEAGFRFDRVVAIDTLTNDKVAVAYKD
ncbi:MULTISPECIES: methyltransferase [unclassified Nocardiopsis]|uniref:methyltransferase n=1 Tax=Nocardiopsis TaxID=2013 RepID=UPI00387B413D